MINGIEKLKQIKGLKELNETKDLEKLSHEFQGKDNKIWNQRNRLSALLFNLEGILSSKLNATIKGSTSKNSVNEDAKKQYLDVSDDTIMPFFKCIINKEFDTFQDESSDVLHPEQSKNLTDIQKQVDSLANDFNNEENGLTEDDLSDELKETEDKFEQIVHSLCLKKKQTESRLDKGKINKVVDHLDQMQRGIISYYYLVKTNNAFKQGKDIPASVSYPILSCFD